MSVCETVGECTCTSVSFSTIKWAGPFRFLLQEQKSNVRFSEHLCVCAFVRLMFHCHLSPYVSITGKKAMAPQMHLSSSSALLHLTCCFLITFSQHTSPFFHVSLTLVCSFSCSFSFAWRQMLQPDKFITRIA